MHVDVPISDDLVRSAAQLWGDVGRRWIHTLPDVVRSLLDDWDLALGDQFPLSLHWVAAVTTADGERAALKVGPVEPRHLPAEAEALRLFAGRGSVRVLREDLGRGALLLEQADPGISLERMVPRRDVEATGVLVDMIHTLHRAPTPDSRLPDVLAQRSSLDDHVRGSGLVPARLVTRASGLFAELSADVTDPVVLHGDLHHGNVLQARRSPWLAIDPHGSVGDRGYEVGSILYNPHQTDRDPGLVALVPGRVEQLADGLDLPVDRVLAWGFVKAVLAQVWECERGARVIRAMDVALFLEPRVA